ncbi:hypothetical protein F5888DRAFT_1097662 [Russula emetica]|nr:hypothetical protein F5888DRAFT_1097662 [Russula emetica]
MRAHTARIQQCCLTLSFTQILEYISTVIWTVGTGFRRKLLMWLWWLCITVDHHRPCGQKVFARPAYCHTVVCVTWCTAMPAVWVSPLTEKRKCYCMPAGRKNLAVPAAGD